MPYMRCRYYFIVGLGFYSLYSLLLRISVQQLHLSKPNVEALTQSKVLLQPLENLRSCIVIVNFL